jgi:hypothetical protein
MSTLSRTKHVLAAAGLACAFAALPAAAAQPLKPFSADYQASYMGLQGNGRMTLESQGGNKWKYTLAIGSSGIQLNQDTVFEDRSGDWRPLSSRNSSLLLIKKSDKSAVYDWDQGVATWSGDVKADRAGPVKLQPGDVDGLLLNLVIARDVAAGKPLNYRLVDSGRAKALSYKIEGKEAVTVDGKQKQATKVVQTDGNKQILVWVVDGLPVPARILQRKDGKDDIDLRIKTTH